MPTTVLLCDTADEVARLQYHLLRELPEVVVEVTNDAFRAVEVAGRTRPEVVICELTLEGLAGAELVRRFRASSPQSRVFAWSASHDPTRVAETLGAGAAGFLSKDDGPGEVLMAIRTADRGGVRLSQTVAGILSDELHQVFSRARELEAELKEIRSSTRAGSSAKADFLANVSHELRTPVTVAKGIAYVLRNPAVPEAERVDFLDQLQGALDRLIAIVDELITIAELERGTFELDLVPTDLAPLIRNAAEEVARQYPHVELERNVPDELRAVADAPRIAAVVRELLDNACRYSPPSAPVEVRARILTEGVVVSVTDRGEGLDRSVATRAFDEPFSTGESVLRKERDGVGVGLHLARQVIVEHGGIMWSDPLPGGGTRVSFCIPAHAGDRIHVPPSNI